MIRRVRRVVGLGPVALVVLSLAVLAACGGGAPKLTGTDLGKVETPNFTLTDQRGQPVTLSQLRGRAVALTFIYTHCPDVCPLIAEHFRAAYEELPADMRDRVAFVAVTVDPARDDAAALQAFSAQHGLADNPQWHALTGDQATLEQVWKDYYIDPGTIMDEDHGAHDHDVSPTAAASDDTLAHTDAIFLIDPDGRQRVLMRSSADVPALVDNLKALLE